MLSFEEGRSGGRFSRSAPKPSKARAPAPAPAPSPARSPALLQSGPTTGGLGSVVAEGMAFGAGNAVAHRAVDSMMGPRVVHHETVASAAAPPSVGNLDTCVGQYKAFEDVLLTKAHFAYMNGEHDYEFLCNDNSRQRWFMGLGHLFRL